MKVCAICETEKRLEAFHRQPTGKFGRHSYCAKCACARQKETRQRNYSPEQKRRWQLKTRYGLSANDLQALITRQGGKCTLCDCELRKPHVDHCHNTGVIRGILCHKCNVRLGGWDNIAWRERAIVYLGLTEARRT